MLRSHVGLSCPSRLYGGILDDLSHSRSHIPGRDTAGGTRSRKIHHTVSDGIRRDSSCREELGGDGGLFGQKSQEKMLRADVGVSESRCLPQCAVQGVLRPTCKSICHTKTSVVQNPPEESSPNSDLRTS